MNLTHLSLFSGIGGLDLAAEWAGFTTVGQCEFADYPTKVLEKHWPDVPRWRDIHDLSADDFRTRTGIHNLTVISGGFPCQPHSLAGKRKSSNDERDLWSEYRRVIGELKPEWVVAENVRGLLTSEDGQFLRGILRDFADLGFDAGWCTYPASWVGAIHRRERVFVVAHAHSKRRNSVVQSVERQSASLDLEMLDSLRAGQNNIPLDLDGFFSEPGGGAERNDNGVPAGLDRLRAIGNAVMPAQAYPIFKAIAELCP